MSHSTKLQRLNDTRSLTTRAPMPGFIYKYSIGRTVVVLIAMENHGATQKHNNMTVSHEKYKLFGVHKTAK